VNRVDPFSKADERQRRSVTEPRVAPQALPWVIWPPGHHQPQRGCDTTALTHHGRNPVGVDIFTALL